MTTLCFYQGLKTIGGTVLEIETEHARCLFDFGLAFSSQADARVLPRQDAMVSDALKTGALPMAEGLYDRGDLGDVPLAPWGDTRPRPFVLISHMHIDHMGGLGLLAEDAEVVMSADSLKLYQGLEKTGELLRRAHPNVRGAASMEWMNKGDLSFRFIPVDHDVPGACGFEIVTPDGRLCYTGDLRIHGFHGEMTRRFATLVKGADVCIAEGTSVSLLDDFDAVAPDDGLRGTLTERELQGEIAMAVRDTEGVVYLNVYPRNILRLHALHETLGSAGRRFVLEPGTAALYRQFYPSDSVSVYAPLADRRDLPDADYVAREPVQAHPERYTLQLSYAHLLETLDFKPEGSLYIHSDGAPLGGYDPGQQKLRDFLAQRRIAYVKHSCSGHAEPAHLKYILMEIAPKTLVPLHSRKPELLRVPGARQLLPEAGRRYRLEDGALL